jgi:delta24-sterol reductase
MSMQSDLASTSLRSRAARLLRPSAKKEPSSATVGSKATELAIKYRWLIVVPLVLPASKVYDLYWTARHVYYRNLRSNSSRHGARVQTVVDQIKSWNESGRPGLLHTSRKSWQSVSVRAIEYKQKSKSGIAVELHDILELDEQRGIVKVEPRVNMGQLTSYLSRRGWTIPVVPELDDLTVGGLLLGYGIESSSHKYGLFADIVEAAELVLSDGRVVRASKTENADLFHALPWSYGAHGMLTALELKAIRAKPYVHLTYEPVQGLTEICKRFSDLASAKDAPEFLDAIMYTRDTGVLVYGDFAELPQGERPNRIGRFYKPWFYKYLERTLTEGGRKEYVPLREYYHRYTRSLYWHGELLVPFGNHPLFRYALGWLMPPKVSVLRLVQTERIRNFRDERNVVQDVLMPMRHLEAGVEMFHREFECYPLWLCAHRTIRSQPAGMINPSLPDVDEEMYVDIGAWQTPGMVKRGEPWDGREAVRKMEAWLRGHGGFQTLYAVTEQTRSEFWQMFDRTLYEQVRTRYGALGAFMDVYDKIKRPNQS